MKLFAVPLVVALLLAATTFAATADDVDAGGETCIVDVSSGGFGGTQGVNSSGNCVPASAGPISSGVALQTKVIDCGRPSSQDNGFWDVRCGAPKVCVDPADPKQTPFNEFATLIKQGNTWIVQSVWCPADANPVPTRAAIRDQALRLLPHVDIGSAWPGTALVNAETVLWAKTDANRTLRTVTVVGKQVQLRIAFDHATWNYGDGSSDTWKSPGKAYDKAGDPCNTAQCADYSGHTYTHTGTVRISLTVAWHAQFSLDGGGTWTDVDDAALTGPAITHTVVLKQARGVLVPNP